MIGFLSPNGKFYSCEPWCHLDAAETICDQVYNKYFPFRDEAENYLLQKGYLELRQKDSFMSMFDAKGKPIFLSKKQIKFLTDNAENLSVKQKADLSKLLLEQDIRRKEFKKRL